MIIGYHFLMNLVNSLVEGKALRFLPVPTPIFGDFWGIFPKKNPKFMLSLSPKYLELFKNDSPVWGFPVPKISLKLSQLYPNPHFLGKILEPSITINGIYFAQRSDYSRTLTSNILSDIVQSYLNTLKWKDVTFIQKKTV